MLEHTQARSAERGVMAGTLAGLAFGRGRVDAAPPRRGWPSRLGPRREAVRFYGVLFALELAILLFFTACTALEQHVIQPK